MTVALARRAPRASFLPTLMSAIFAAILALLPGQYAKADDSDPKPVVEQFHAKLLDVMKSADKLGFQGRYDRLAPEIKKTFDLPGMMQATVGSDWQKAPDDQRQRVVDAFTDLSISTYASQFDGYSGESFKTVGERPGPNGIKIVDTQIVRPDNVPVGLSYVMRQVDGEWRVVDVLMESSISQLAVRRSEYRKVIQDKGLDGLTSTLREKAKQLVAAK